MLEISRDDVRRYATEIRAKVSDDVIPRVTEEWQKRVESHLAKGLDRIVDRVRSPVADGLGQLTKRLEDLKQIKVCIYPLQAKATVHRKATAKTTRSKRTAKAAKATKTTSRTTKAAKPKAKKTRTRTKKS